VAALTDLTINDPCLMFALRREAAPFRREFRPQQRFPGAPCWARFCGPAWLSVLVLETGMGEQRTAEALTWALGRPLLDNLAYRPSVVLSAGFAGALQPGYQVGEVVLATEIRDTEGGHWPTTWPGELPPGPWQPPIRRGALLTAPHLVSEPSGKRELGEKYGAVAVDMESATVARACSREAVPFGCVRVISDDVDTALSPQLAALLSGGRVSALRLLGLLLRRPFVIRELWRLGRHTRHAAVQLGKALGELLTLTLPGGKDL
jgi:adenosylhomocysteine nucleosidase